MIVETIKEVKEIKETKKNFNFFKKRLDISKKVCYHVVKNFLEVKMGMPWSYQRPELQKGVIKMNTEKKFVLLKDIVIPKGTVFYSAPTKTERFGDEHFSVTVGLSDNTSGEFEYCIDEIDELSEYFAELKE